MANLRALVECAPFVARGDIEIAVLEQTFKLTKREMVIFRHLIDNARMAESNIVARHHFLPDLNPKSTASDKSPVWPSLYKTMTKD